jgi:hypothetical protein
MCANTLFQVALFEKSAPCFVRKILIPAINPPKTAGEGGESRKISALF